MKLTISPEYVKHWGLWEAIRELIQNAYDQKIAQPSTKIIIDRVEDSVVIWTDTGRLSKKSLLLGISDKTEQQRGQFGEGYKLALLVLCRLKLEVGIFNNDEFWMPTIQHDEEFDAEVLNIDIRQNSVVTPGVRFRIMGISDEQWADIKRNLVDPEPTGTMLLPEQEAGRIFVGGLFVCHLKDYKYSYSLPAMKLDRDRQMVSDFDLGLKTSAYWMYRPESYDMIQAEVPDVKYCQYVPVVETTFYSALGKTFQDRYGSDVIPVSSGEEIKAASAAKKKWQLVPGRLKEFLMKVIDCFIPSAKPIHERLQDLREALEWKLEDNQKKELDDIIQTLKNANS